MTRRFVIAGGGVAGWSAARALRKRGFADEIVLVGAEPHPAYSRPMLSKQFLLNAAKAPADLYLPVGDGLDVRARAGRRAAALELAQRTLTLDDGERLGFDGLVIATGASPRRLPAADIDGVLVLRNVEDAVALRAELQRGARVVVVGAGFVGSEVAAAARHHGLDVTLVDAAALPLEQPLGRIGAATVRDLHAAHGVRLRLGATVTRLTGADRVQAVQLSTGETLPAELVVVGVGVEPGTGWLAGSGVALEGGVLCDATCRVLAADGNPTDGVVAAGDVARWYNPLFDTTMRVEHWNNASTQAEAAAATLLAPDDAAPFAPVPYFWSEQHGARLQVVGHRPAGQDGRLITGQPGSDRFVLAYEAAGRVVGALMVNQPRECRRMLDLITRRADFSEVYDDTGQHTAAAQRVSAT